MLDQEGRWTQEQWGKINMLTEQLAIKDPPPDKATNQMRWVRHMNNLRGRAIELIMYENFN